jgi:hypothetical protein
MDHIPFSIGSPDWIQISEEILNSFQFWVGSDLLELPSPDSVDRARQLFELDAVVLAHGIEEDPIFCFGNQAALDLWEIEMEELLGMPSRLSAELTERSSRSEMLNRGKGQGLIRDYEGIRVSTTGKRFYVRNATIWNLLNEAGVRTGQAAMFRDWEYIN